jgi:hypothetical protein
MAASNVDRRLVVVEAGLQWAWAAALQVRRLRLDDLDAALEPVMTCFLTLERSAFAWEGWRAVDA